MQLAGRVTSSLVVKGFLFRSPRFLCFHCVNKPLVAKDSSAISAVKHPRRQQPQQSSLLTTMVSTRKRTQQQQQQQQQETTTSPPIVESSSNKSDLDTFVSQLCQDAGIESTITRSGWCLKEGLVHIMEAENGKLKPVVEAHGPPKIFTSLSTNCRHDSADDKNKVNDETALYNDGAPKNCFQSLCRIVSGQQLAGAAARVMWNRLLQVADNNLSPQTVLDLAEQGMEDHLRKPAGLSNAKARSIVALANAFQEGNLSEEFLTSTSNKEEVIREALLRIKGIGPWSCDMFLMFHLEKANVLPVGDLGVRKGMQRFCSLRGKARGGYLCQKQDLEVMLKAAGPYHPYQSMYSYYMWKVADTPDFYGHPATPATPKKKKVKVAKQVTP